MDIAIKDNPDRKRFESEVEGHTAIIEYILTSKGMIFLTHTEVPKPIEGQGIAFAMIGKVLEIIQNRELKLAPLCPIVAEYIRRNPEWKKLLAENFNV